MIERADITRTGWCILRTNGRRTLPLAESLNAAGLEAWTPARPETRRVGRSRDRESFVVPIMPTFVFARAAHLQDLFRALSLPTNPHPAFSIFHYFERVPIIADRDIASLRAAEADAKARAERDARREFSRVFPPGTAVKMTEGAYAGLSGIVEDGNGKFALVCFGSRVAKVDTFLLHPDDLHATASDPDAAARAA